MTLKIRRNRIKEWILKRSINQSDLARQLDISTSYLSLIANGKRNPNLRLSTRLANLLDADLLDLFPQLEPPASEVDLVACFGERPEFEVIRKGLASAGLEVIYACGDFDAGYYVAQQRPAAFVVDIESIGRALASLVQRVRAEPLTAHVALIALAGPETGKRRRRQIEKMGLEIHDWNPESLPETIRWIVSAVRSLENKAK